jgi:hypothetical protein
VAEPLVLGLAAGSMCGAVISSSEGSAAISESAFRFHGDRAMAQDEISEAGAKARFAQWDQIGLDRIKADLLSGGHRLVGGPPSVRDLAWKWVRMQEAGRPEIDGAARQPTSPKELLTLKPTLWGVGFDLKEAGRRARRWWKGF